MNTLRQTGRTTRMIEHARRLSAEGRAVYVVVGSERELQRMEIEFGLSNHGITVETPRTLPELDWETLTIPRAHPNCIVLVDHHAIEDRFRAILTMLHAYDKPEEVPGLLNVHGKEWDELGRKAKLAMEEYLKNNPEK